MVKKSVPKKREADQEKPKLPDAERDAVANLRKRTAARVPAPSLTITEKRGVKQIDNSHADKSAGQALLMEAMGIADPAFYEGLVGQLANAGIQGRDDYRGLHFMVAAVKAAEPRDEMEAMLAAQMAAVHMATMTFARRLAHVNSIAQQDSAARAFTKLTRTYATQIEALKRYRTGGEQKVTVQHVHVSDGGQAIVGSVQTGGRGPSGKPEETP